MPQTQVLFYQDDKGHAPVVDWLTDLRKRDAVAYSNCVATIHRLAAAGHELRRPTADYLRDKIYELRAKRGRVNYRILYFFHGRNVAILAHALTKEDKVPIADIERAIRRRELYEANPKKHTYQETARPSQNR
ncbi:MAG TPA: type II toxin-antitoxin system RelE/ParE family toxin [Phycisphaerae bacterium]|nr:type II toxin-antitoxin system RelE/ParE family toxin [Phycisphaerae bacterium]